MFSFSAAPVNEEAFIIYCVLHIDLCLPRQKCTQCHGNDCFRGPCSSSLSTLKSASSSSCAAHDVDKAAACGPKQPTNNKKDLLTFSDRLLPPTSSSSRSILTTSYVRSPTPPSITAPPDASSVVLCFAFDLLTTVPVTHTTHPPRPRRTWGRRACRAPGTPCRSAG